MTKINFTTTFLRCLNNVEHDFLHRNCSQTFTEKGEGITLLTTFISHYQELYKREYELFKLSRKVKDTKLLKQLDNLRDKDFINLKLSVELLIRKNSGNKRATVEKIYSIIMRYKNMHKKPYDERTDLIIDLLQNLDKDPCIEYLSQLNLSEDVAKLKKSNQAFYDVYREHSNSNSTNTQGRLLEARHQVDEAFVQLTDIINAHYISTSFTGVMPDVTPVLKAIITEISAFIRQSEKVYYRRAPMKKPKQKLI